jgi:hypothetical protein
MQDMIKDSVNAQLKEWLYKYVELVSGLGCPGIIANCLYLGSEGRLEKLECLP